MSQERSLIFLSRSAMTLKGTSRQLRMPEASSSPRSLSLILSSLSRKAARQSSDTSSPFLLLLNSQAHTKPILSSWNTRRILALPMLRQQLLLHLLSPNFGFEFHTLANTQRQRSSSPPESQRRKRCLL